MDFFEAIVIGAGPAGSVAARDLARSGARVALVDGSHPREKACGGGVTGRALELLAEKGTVPFLQFSKDAGAGRAIRSVRFEAGKRSAEVALPDEHYIRIFDRERFDAALKASALEAGAVELDTRVTRIEPNRPWTVTTTDGRQLSARWLLGADGAAGIVRKQVARPFDRTQISVAAGSYVDGVESSEIVIGFVEDPRGYLWSFPRPGHLAVGTCAQADEATSGAMHAITDRWLDGHAPAAGRPRRRYAWPIPSLGADDLDRDRPSGDGWMLLGDAAGLVDPITREGIYFAIRSGMFAAETLRTADPARSYAEAIRDDVHDELRRAARLKAGFFHPRFTSLLIDALNQSEAIRGVMIDLVAGRQSHRGLKRRLLGTLELSLALRVWYGGRRVEVGGR